MAETCNIDVAGSFLRMEYMQDLDGAWLEPHRDIPEKLFSMVVYLFTGPDAKDWGTDIYDAEQALGGAVARHIQFGGDLRAGTGHLARLRTAADRRRAPADGDQLRPRRLAGPRPTGLPGRMNLSRVRAGESLPPGA